MGSRAPEGNRDLWVRGAARGIPGVPDRLAPKGIKAPLGHRENLVRRVTREKMGRHPHHFPKGHGKFTLAVIACLACQVCNGDIRTGKKPLCSIIHPVLQKPGSNGHTVNGFKALLHGWVLLSKGVTVVADGFPI